MPVPETQPISMPIPGARTDSYAGLWVLGKARPAAAPPSTLKIDHIPFMSSGIAL